MTPRLVIDNTGAAPPQRAGNPTIVHALKMWDDAWSASWPPVNAIADRATLAEHPRINLRLAQAFRRIARLPTTEERLEWLEREVLRTDDYALAPDPYRATLMRWWLDIFAWAFPARDTAYSRTGRGSSSH